MGDANLGGGATTPFCTHIPSVVMYLLCDVFCDVVVMLSSILGYRTGVMLPSP